ncbi:MAG: hypothetical protein ACRDNK_09745 [Solirubrobacteraceae bacterium]
MIRPVQNLQPIIHNGQLAAVVIAGQAIITDTLPAQDLRHVQAMCLYALELADQAPPKSYTDADADEYARAARATS